jgi:hypothetical protein
LPPLVRDGDEFSAMLTLRNTTAREMKMRVALAGSATKEAAGARSVNAAGAAVAIALSPQEVAIPAGGAKEVTWPVTVPAEAVAIAWEASAEELGSGPIGEPTG